MIFLSNKILVGIGLISYSLYLWHHPILTFDKILNFSDGNIFIKLGLILVSIILAIFTYLLIEKPFRNQNFYSTKKLVFTFPCKSSNRHFPYFFLHSIITDSKAR